MKRFFITVLTIVFVVLLMSCEAGEKEDKQVNINPTKETKQEEQTEVSFRGVHVDVKAREVVIEGKVKTNQPEFYYEMEQGGKTLVKETAYPAQEAAEKWESFKIHYDVAKEVREQGELVVINIYGKNEQGDKISSNYITVDFSYL